MIPLFTADEQPTMAEFNERITQANSDVQAAIQEAISQAPKIIIGSYTGNGASSRLIDLGAKPDAVLVVSMDGIMGVDGAPLTVKLMRKRLLKKQVEGLQRNLILLLPHQAEKQLR